MRRRPYHHGNLRAALLEQALETVRSQGAAALSLRELAREVGVSHGAPRRHFPDRQALLDALAEQGFRRLGDELRAAVEEAGDGFEERMHATAAAYVRFATTDAVLVELMFASKQSEETGVLHEAADRAFSVVLDLIAQGQAEGAIEDGDPERVGLVLFASIQGVATLVGAGMVEPGRLDELVQDAIAHFLRGSAPLQTGS